MPRVLMSLILAATGAAGFVFSFALLHLGLGSMWLRYPPAVLFAYGVFLLLLRIWLHLQRHSWTDLMPDGASPDLTTGDVGARAGSRPSRYDLIARNWPSADSPPPPISPSPTSPSSVSTSTIVRTKRPRWQPFACLSGASSGTVTVVALMSVIFIGRIDCLVSPARSPARR